VRNYFNFILRLLEYQNLMQVTPLLYHFCYSAKQWCHVLSKKCTVSFVWQFTHCHISQTD